MFTGMPSSWSLEMQAGCWVPREKGVVLVWSHQEMPRKNGHRYRGCQHRGHSSQLHCRLWTLVVLVNLPEFKILAHFVIFWPILCQLLWQVLAKSQEVPWIRSARGQDPIVLSVMLCQDQPPCIRCVTVNHRVSALVPVPPIPPCPSSPAAVTTNPASRQPAQCPVKGFY